MTYFSMCIKQRAGKLVEKYGASKLFPYYESKFVLYGKKHINDKIISSCPNGDVKTNMIPVKTHITLAGTIGFDLIKSKDFTIQRSLHDGKIECVEERGGLFSSVVLKRSSKAKMGRKELTEEFVKDCDGAYDAVGKFIRYRVIGVMGYPFISDKVKKA